MLKSSSSFTLHRLGGDVNTAPLISKFSATILLTVNRSPQLSSILISEALCTCSSHSLSRNTYSHDILALAVLFVFQASRQLLGVSIYKQDPPLCAQFLLFWVKHPDCSYLKLTIPHELNVPILTEFCPQSNLCPREWREEYIPLEYMFR